MLSSRGEGEPAKPQEGQEFNKEKPNSKARTRPPEQGAEPDGVEENRDPNGPTAGENPAGTGGPDGGARSGRHPDERPVPHLEPAKVWRRGHFARIA